MAAMGEGETPASAGDAYVATLFDQHADDFEDILVRQLGYGVINRRMQRLSQWDFLNPRPPAPLRRRRRAS